MSTTPAPITTPGLRYAVRSATPAPRSPILLHADAGGEATADLAKAWDELETWLRAYPSERSVWTIDRIAGKWRVGLKCGEERLSASQDQEIRGAIRNAIMIAKFAGYL